MANGNEKEADIQYSMKAMWNSVTMSVSSMWREMREMTDISNEEADCVYEMAQWSSMCQCLCNGNEMATTQSESWQ